MFHPCRFYKEWNTESWQGMKYWDKCLLDGNTIRRKGVVPNCNINGRRRRNKKETPNGKRSYMQCVRKP